MKYQISPEQRHFFENKRYIEFEALLTDAECHTLATACKKEKRDLARRSPEAKKILFQPKFSQIAAELLMQRELRYGFDELYTTSKKTVVESSCVRGIVFAMLISLAGDKTGNVVFFSPDQVVNPELFFGQEKGTYLLFTWADRTPLYIHNPDDQYTHELKRLGYVFGDRLSEQSHPTLWR